VKPLSPTAIEEIRSGICDAVPKGTSEHGGTLERKFLYLPPRHSQALSPDNPLVVGIRGAGKSVWWAALQSPKHRDLIARALPKSDISRASLVTPGFGETEQPELYPDKRTLRALLKQGYSAVNIWRTVVAYHTWGKLADSSLKTCGSWAERTQWIEEHPEQTAKAFAGYEKLQRSTRNIHLILFDAIDRTADAWEDLRHLLRGLLQLLLEFRSFQGIRAKAFVRPDMLDDSAVVSFRDASKITANSVELRWDRADLYSLFWQRLANTKGGQEFRKLCKIAGVEQWAQVEETWQIPKVLQVNEDVQRNVFHELAGQWMGTDRRRGFPYTWLPSHLADAADQVSPRSFLAALRTAAEQSNVRGGNKALHYEAIKKGVQAASTIRVEEVSEDFYWVPTLMEPLRALVIPCSFDEIRDRWQKGQVETAIRKQLGTANGLSPKRLDLGLEGLCQDMLSLALFSEMRDRRINMPDVYRVGFGLGRRGGVKPIS